jgi:hypothetical protein
MSTPHCRQARRLHDAAFPHRYRRSSFEMLEDRLMPGTVLSLSPGLLGPVGLPDDLLGEAALSALGEDEGGTFPWRVRARRGAGSPDAAAAGVKAPRLWDDALLQRLFTSPASSEAAQPSSSAAPRRPIPGLNFTVEPDLLTDLVSATDRTGHDGARGVILGGISSLAFGGGSAASSDGAVPAVPATSVTRPASFPDATGDTDPVATGVSPVVFKDNATGETPVATGHTPGETPVATERAMPAEGPRAASPQLSRELPKPAVSATRRLGFHHGLEGWTIHVAGGTEQGKGSVRAGSAILHEGDSFSVSLEREFEVPENPAPLVFRYTELSFDTADPDSINDAFEASVIDAAGRTLVHSFTTGRDAFFNVTEEVGLALGPGATEEGDAIRTVTLDMSGVLPGTLAKVRFRLVNNDQDTETSVRILDVIVPGDNEPPVVTATPADATAQYSDPVGPVVITVTDDSEGPLTTTTAYSVNGGDFVPDLPQGLALSGSGADGAGTWTLSGIADVAPAEYVVRVTLADVEGEAASIDIPVTVTQEDARATYSGVVFVSTSSDRDTDAVVTLRAVIQDITAVDPDADPDPGDIRNATVSFVNRDSGAVIASGLPVTLIDAGDPKTGVASHDWTVDLGSSNSESFTIGIVVDGYYTRNSPADDTVVTVSKPLDDFITGGGYLVNEATAGTYAGDAGARTNFGFNVKFNKQRTNLQGHVNIIVRRGDRVYQIKSNSTT